MRLIWFTILNLVIFSDVAQIQPSVELNQSTKKILIGEQLTVDYALKVNASDSVKLPLFTDTVRKEVEIVNASKVDTSFDENDVSIKLFKQTLTLTSFDSGYHAVKPIQFFVNNQLVESQPFLVEVHTVQLTQQELKDIKSPFEAELTLLDYLKLYWMYILGGLAVVGVIALIIWYLKTREKPIIEQIIQKPQIPPHVIALEKLTELQKKKLWQSGDLKGYYSSLTTIIREYIELRYNILALEQTTSERLSDLSQKQEIANDLKEKLKELLLLADLVKFAKMKTLAEENEKLFAYAKLFIEETKQNEKAAENNVEPEVKPNHV